MSMLPPTIRANPRWSNSGALALSPASRAGLPRSSADQIGGDVAGAAAAIADEVVALAGQDSEQVRTRKPSGVPGEDGIGDGTPAGLVEDAAALAGSRVAAEGGASQG